MSWNLDCPWCKWYIVVSARGGRGNDQGAGMEAADLMKEHITNTHNKTWKEFILYPARIIAGT